MIKFFRKIRKKLIEQSKVRNYFFYAIGEIVLVVIDILISENLASNLKSACQTDRYFKYFIGEDELVVH